MFVRSHSGNRAQLATESPGRIREKQTEAIEFQIAQQLDWLNEKLFTG